MNELLAAFSDPALRSRLVDDVLTLLQASVLCYFAAMSTISMVVGYLGLRTMRTTARLGSAAPLADLLAYDAHKPVSILVPAYNEAGSIVESVRSFLRLRFPEFEVIVVSDGSTDDTIERLTEAFALVEQQQIYPERIRTSPVRRVLRSLRHPNLVVVEKENGGKGDALNAALNLSRFPLICTVDADSLLEAEALLRASRHFLDDETVIAVGGSIRPLNGATVHAGQVTGLHLPQRWIERFQIVEYARSFFTGRVGWGSVNALPIISGAFGMFRRDRVLTVGGYRTETVGEDLELVLRLHRHHREQRIPYRIVSLPEPMCWTEVPSDWASLRRQRNRWQRGLWEALWIHRGMFLNPRYGRLGTLSLPFLWLFEAISPFVEMVGYVLLPVALVLGALEGEFALLFLSLAMAYGALLSMMAVGVEMLLLHRYPTLRERVVLLVASLVEVIGYRQVLVLERFLANFQVWSKRGTWGKARRLGIRSVEPAAAGAGAGPAAAAERERARRSA
ncbi:glycosyltransferase family 2 protein [Vulgatibacter sp.]|uniref:glycosyltransferase family 2 protein n=1 Tax=Vulgatibacter sp. TaxID=1971226 RepID=UPI00356858EB